MKMSSKRLLSSIVSGIFVVSMMISGCSPSPSAATEFPMVTEAPVESAAPTAAPTELPVPPTTRHGGWLDEIDYSAINAQSAIPQISAGAVDLFSYGLSSDKLADIKASGFITYSNSCFFITGLCGFSISLDLH
jgi:hypothetical protein